MLTGKTKLAVGRVRIISKSAQEADAVGILYMGEHNLIGGVCKFASPEASAAAKKLLTCIKRRIFPQVIQLAIR